MLRDITSNVASNVNIELAEEGIQLPSAELFYSSLNLVHQTEKMV